jgi:hypothetical protein
MGVVVMGNINTARTAPPAYGDQQQPYGQPPAPPAYGGQPPAPPAYGASPPNYSTPQSSYDYPASPGMPNSGTAAPPNYSGATAQANPGFGMPNPNTGSMTGQLGSMGAMSRQENMANQLRGSQRPNNNVIGSSATPSAPIYTETGTSTPPVYSTPQESYDYTTQQPPAGPTMGIGQPPVKPDIGYANLAQNRPDRDYAAIKRLEDAQEQYANSPISASVDPATGLPMTQYGNQDYANLAQNRPYQDYAGIKRAEDALEQSVVQPIARPNPYANVAPQDYSNALSDANANLSDMASRPSADFGNYRRPDMIGGPGPAPKLAPGAGRLPVRTSDGQGYKG